MKKGTLVLAVILVLVLSVGAFAQNEPERVRQNVISINPLSWAGKVINLSYERVVSPGWSIVLDPRFTFGEASGVAIIAGIRNYISPIAPQGYFIGGSGVFASLREGIVSEKLYGFGGDLGYKWILGNGFAFEYGWGLKYVTNTVTILEGYFEGKTYIESGLMYTYFFGLGYAF